MGEAEGLQLGLQQVGQTPRHEFACAAHRESIGLKGKAKVKSSSFDAKQRVRSSMRSHNSSNFIIYIDKLMVMLMNIRAYIAHTTVFPKAIVRNWKNFGRDPERCAKKTWAYLLFKILRI